MPLKTSILTSSCQIPARWPRLLLLSLASNSKQPLVLHRLLSSTSPFVHEVLAQLLQLLPLLCLLDFIIHSASLEDHICLLCARRRSDLLQIVFRKWLSIAIRDHLHQQLWVIPHEVDDVLPADIFVLLQEYLLWLTKCIRTVLDKSELSITKKGHKLVKIDVSASICDLLSCQFFYFFNNLVDSIDI